MAKVVDARGFPCPQPVILTRNALREDSNVTTIVDNDTSRRNVTRMAERAGYTVQAEERGDGIYLHISGGKPVEEPSPGEAALGKAEIPSSGPLVLVVPSEFMGQGDEELGRILVRSFFHTLGEVDPVPDAIVLFNSGVKLVVEGSPVLEDLQALCSRGIEILACGTCLGYYGLKDKVVVGEVSNMYTIVETMMNAGKVIRL